MLRAGLILASLLGTGSGDAATVCVVRPEDNGAINIRPVRVIAVASGRQDERLVASVNGGETVCASLAPGDWLFEARSAHPYDPTKTRPDECRSKPLRRYLRAGEQARIRVTPSSRGSEYVCGWRLR